MIITGGPAHNRFVEAEVMARVAEAQGFRQARSWRAHGAGHDREYV